MSMICWVLGLLPAQIRALRATPSLATDVALAAQGDESGELDQLGPLQEALDLEKSWHILHYLFTGSLDDMSSPGAALLSGEDLGEDVGYGPARLHGENQTAAFAHFLETLDLASLHARVNYTEMASIGVYSIPRGSAAVAGYESELRDEVGYYFPRLRDYVLQVAEKHGGLLTWIS
jgi:Domain of unknown function (DUF1877)